MRGGLRMIEFYAQIKWVHVASVVASGLLFLMRGLLVQAGRERMAMLPSLRYLSYSIDTVLLSAAFMLLTILPDSLYANGWLALKLVLLVVYVVLGSLALKRGRTARTRALTFMAAVVIYVGIIGVARMHHPLGWLYYALG